MRSQKKLAFSIFNLLCTALIWASYNGHTQIIKMLVKQEGIDINAKDIKCFYQYLFQLLNISK